MVVHLLDAADSVLGCWDRITGTWSNLVPSSRQGLQWDQHKCSCGQKHGQVQHHWSRSTSQTLWIKVREIMLGHVDQFKYCNIYYNSEGTCSGTITSCLFSFIRHWYSQQTHEVMLMVHFSQFTAIKMQVWSLWCDIYSCALWPYIQ